MAGHSTIILRITPLLPEMLRLVAVKVTVELALLSRMMVHSLQLLVRTLSVLVCKIHSVALRQVLVNHSTVLIAVARILPSQLVQARLCRVVDLDLLRKVSEVSSRVACLTLRATNRRSLGTRNTAALAAKPLNNILAMVGMALTMHSQDTAQVTVVEAGQVSMAAGNTRRVDACQHLSCERTTDRTVQEL